MKPVVVVGAGLAGLTCARALKRVHTPFLVIEASDRLGGRLKTDQVGAFRLDRGFHPYFTASPHARGQLDEDKLGLRAFDRGAIIVWDGDAYLVDRDRPVWTALSGFLSMADRLKLGAWTSDVQWLDPVDVADIPDLSVQGYLEAQGFSKALIEKVMRPFATLLLSDASLASSCRSFIHAWKALTEGDMTLPALGIEEIPRQIGETFGPQVLRLDAEVASLDLKSGVVAGVRLADGEAIEASRVVLAVDAPTASRLSGLPIPVEFVPVTTLYFTAPASPVEGGWIVLNGNMRGITQYVVPISNLDPAAPPLMSATILGDRTETDDQLADIVKSEMRVWFPHHDSETWRLVGATRERQMIDPRAKAPTDAGIPGLLFAGEFTTRGSIDGAIQSGLDCAAAILSSREASVA